MEETMVRIKLAEIRCCKCGVFFWVDLYLQCELKNSHRSFYCPHGHSQSYVSKSEAERLREELIIKHGEVQGLEASNKRLVNDLLDKTKEIAKVKKRICAGVCLECHRHFVNLERHMKSKHKKGG